MNASRTGLAGIVGLSLLLAACGSDGRGEDGVTVEASVGGSTTATDTATPSCRDVENMVVVSVFGAATEGGEDEVSKWASDPENLQPVARPGAAAVATAYRDLGYHIFYASLHSSEAQIGDQPLADAITVWLGLNGFPIGGDDTHVWAWEGDGEPSVALIEKLFYVTSEGATLQAGYTGDTEVAQALASSGIPRDRLFKVGKSGNGVYTPIAEDLSEHLPEVAVLEPVCQ